MAESDEDLGWAIRPEYLQEDSDVNAMNQSVSYPVGVENSYLAPSAPRRESEENISCKPTVPSLLSDQPSSDSRSSRTTLAMDWEAQVLDEADSTSFTGGGDSGAEIHSHYGEPALFSTNDPSTSQPQPESINAPLSFGLDDGIAQPEHDDVNADIRPPHHSLTIDENILTLSHGSPAGTSNVDWACLAERSQNTTFQQATTSNPDTFVLSTEPLDPYHQDCSIWPVQDHTRPMYPFRTYPEIETAMQESDISQMNRRQNLVRPTPGQIGALPQQTHPFNRSSCLHSWHRQLSIIATTMWFPYLASAVTLLTLLLRPSRRLIWRKPQVPSSILDHEVSSVGQSHYLRGRGGEGMDV